MTTAKTDRRRTRPEAARIAAWLALVLLLGGTPACGGGGGAASGRPQAATAGEEASEDAGGPAAAREGAEQGAATGAEAPSPARAGEAGEAAVAVPPGFEDVAPTAEDADSADGGAEPQAQAAAAPRPRRSSRCGSSWWRRPRRRRPPSTGRGPRGGERRTGDEIGCGDRLVALEVPIEPVAVATTEEHLRVVLDTLFSLQPEDVPSDLMTALRRSPLRVDAVTPVPATPGAYRVLLGGPLRIGGACDAPRVRAQIVDTARAVEGVEEVQVFLGSEPLDALLSARGAR